MITRKVVTRTDKNAAKVETTVTVDFSGVPQEKIEELAGATAIINKQAEWRVGTIPAGNYTLKVADQLARPKGAGGFKPMTPESVMAKALADPAFMAALKEQLRKK